MTSERSTRAVVFCDVVASTELRGRMGDTRADAWFAGLLGRIEAAVTDVDGIVVKGLGDGVMAVFTSAGDALDAAVAMQQANLAYGRLANVEAASLRVGVSIGDISRTGDDWNGMPVVQAARLCSAAAPDEILAADVVRVLAGSRCSHSMSPAGDFQLKGIPDAVAVARVDWSPAPAATTAAFPALLEAARRGPFVGRTLVLADLYDTWKSKEWRAALVAGEPGIGKTRLVSELAFRMHGVGCAIVVGRCDEELAVAYRPWTEALETLIDAMDPDDLAGLPPEQLAELCRLVPSLARRVDAPTSDLAVDGDTRHAMIVDSVIALLRIAGPLAVVLDDMHWIDQRSLQLVRGVLGATDLADVTIIGTYRDTDLDAFHPLTAALADLRRATGIRRVALSGLDGPAVVEFLEYSAGHELDTDGLTLAQAVHDRTAGNPLFVGELLRHLADSGAIQFVDERWVGGAEPLAFPDGLREVIARRLTSLGAGAMRVLQLAAVVGPSFDVDMVEEVIATESGDDDVLTAIERAQAAGIVTDSGRMFSFRHAVIRDVILAELSGVRRQRAHRAVVVVLEQRWALSLDNHLEELAYHHGQARTPQAASWYLRAAQAAARSLDSNAAALADRGVALLDLVQPPDPALHCDLLIARANGMRLTGAETLDDAKTAFDAALSLGDPQRIGAALLSVSLKPATASQVDHLAFLSEGLQHLQDSTLITRWNAEAAFVVREFMDADTDPAEHRRRVNEIVAHLDPSDTLACQIAMRLARSLTSTNQADDALVVSEHFMANCDGVDTEGFPIEVSLSNMWMHLGDRDISDRYFAAVQDDPRRSYWFFDCQVLQRKVMGNLLDGNWAAASEAIAEAERIGGHDENVLLTTAAQTGWLRGETGDVDANYKNVLDYTHALPQFPLLRALLVREAAECGYRDEALSLLDRFATDDFRGVGRGWLTLAAIGNVAWAAVTLGAMEHASTIRRLLAPYAGQIAVVATGTHVMGAVDRLIAGLAALDGHHLEADERFAHALSQEQALRARPLEARTLQWWGRALRARGESERGTELLMQARAMADELGMRAVVNQIDAPAAT